MTSRCPWVWLPIDENVTHECAGLVGQSLPPAVHTWQVTELGTVLIGRPISAATAQTVREMMVKVVQNGVDDAATVPGYTVAGKTGTAQIFSPVGPEQGAFNMTFVGFLPADDPQISVLVWLNRPKSAAFASQTAAPVFARLAERLVVMLEIPTDDVRLALSEQGGNIGEISR